MDIKQFISENEVETCENLIDAKMLEDAEKATSIHFGDELTEYLLTYGYLAYEYVELYGMNSKQGLDSDLVRQTLYLHKYFPNTEKYVALENQGDGDYYLVDSEDAVYEFDSHRDFLAPTGLTLLKYILRRFEEVENNS